MYNQGMKRTTTTTITIALLALVSCKTAVLAPQATKTTSQLREFRRLKPGPSEVIAGFRLAAVDRMAGDPVAYTPTNQYFQWMFDYPSPHLNVTFPSLTLDQFNALKGAYGFGLSRVKYKRGESYTLADFLMPFMQATLNHEFESEVQADYTRIGSNCWGTAYEVIRTSTAGASAIMFYADTTEMQAVLQDDTRSQRLGRAKSVAGIQELAEDSTTPVDFGDVFLILDEAGTLEHVLVSIDQDVWFEKVGYGGGSPYRLTTTKAFFHKVDNGRTIEWRRFPRGGLPHPEELFKTIRYLEPVPGGTTRILEPPVPGPLSRREVKFVFDSMGRASLEASAYRPAGRPKP